MRLNRTLATGNNVIFHEDEVLARHKGQLEFPLTFYVDFAALEKDWKLGSIKAGVTFLDVVPR